MESGRAVKMADVAVQGHRPGGLELTLRGLKAASPPQGGRIIDIACGLGATVGHLTEQGYDCIGLDRDEAAIKTAAKIHKKAQFIKADGDKLPFAGEYTDTVFIECALSLISNPAPVINEAARVLRCGGSLVLTDLYATKEELLSGDIYMRLKAKIEELILAAGLEIILFEDHLPHLKQYYGQLIFDDEIEDSVLCRADTKLMAQSGASYFLLVATKKGIPSQVYLQSACRMGAKSAPELLEKQVSAAKISAKRAKEKSLFYAKSLAGFDIDNMDWMDIPLTAATDIAENPMSFLSVAANDIERIVTVQSSGTKNPKRIMMDEADLEKSALFFERGMSDLVAKGDTVAVFMRDGQGSIADLLRQGLAKIGVSCHCLWDFDDIDTACQTAKGANCIIAQPCFARTLCLMYPNLRPEAVLLSADYVPQSTVKLIERIWGCTVYSHYGLTETGFGLAVECKNKNGMHIRDDEFLIEILDKKSGRPVLAGQLGEVVITSITDRAMPLIRYCTGDVARLTCEPCGCGGKFPLLCRIEGRYGDEAALSSGKTVTMRHLDELLCGFAEIIYYSAATEDGELTLSIFTTGDKEKLKAKIKNTLAVDGLFAKVNFLDSLDIKLTNKKRQMR